MPFNGKFVQQVATQFHKRGLSKREIEWYINQELDDLSNENSTVDFKAYNQMLETALRKLKDPFLGIRLSQSLNLNAAGLMLQIAQNSSTFKEAMTHACHYAMLGCQSLPMRIEESEFSYEIVYSYDQRWRMDSELAFQHTLEGAIFFLLKEYESLTNKKCSPIKVTLDYQPQRSFKDYQKWFNCQVFIRDNRNSVVFRKKDFDRTIEYSDYSLLKHLLKFADLKLQKLERRETPFEVASRIIVNTLPDRAKVEEVAREMNMGVRTLQRRLNDEGTSFRDLLEDILLEFARNQIKSNKNINLSELAYLLNYSDLSAFSRAYRKHFGVPPTKHASLKSAA